jgi:centromeric protein E
VKLQSRLEQEEEAKAALLARIQRLTKLILVSTKATPTNRCPERPGPRRRHSFGEEEVQLPHICTTTTTIEPLIPNKLG